MKLDFNTTIDSISVGDKIADRYNCDEDGNVLHYTTVIAKFEHNGTFYIVNDDLFVMSDLDNDTKYKVID